MTNFSSFFPVAAAGGGGGFTKMKKISTDISSDETTDKLVPPSTTLTINPATDLGLSDGDSIGYLLAGGNATGVLRGTAIISNASTDLVITPGLASGTSSTITGGLTLTSADGNTDTSYERKRDAYYNPTYGVNYAYSAGGGEGIDGYGVGSQWSSSFKHGYGGSGKDGAVLLFY